MYFTDVHVTRARCSLSLFSSRYSVVVQSLSINSPDETIIHSELLIYFKESSWVGKIQFIKRCWTLTLLCKSKGRKAGDMEKILLHRCRREVLKMRNEGKQRQNHSRSVNKMIGFKDLSPRTWEALFPEGGVN